MNFKEWLMSESTSINKLAIFDFDGTLADTPLQPDNWVGQPYVAPDGEERDGKDWWAHPDSLGTDFNLNAQVLAAFQKARSEPNTKAIMLTGRVGMRTAHMIREKLRQQGLYGKRMIAPGYNKAISRAKEWPHGDDHPDDSHEEFYKGDWVKGPNYPKTANGGHAGDTFTHKQYVIEMLTDDNIREIDFWDDRKAHYQGFVDLFQKLLAEKPNLQRVNFYVVENGKIRLIPMNKR